MPNPTLYSSVQCSSSGGAWSGSIVVPSSLVSAVLVLTGNAYDGGGTPAFTLGAGGAAFTLFVRRVYASGRTASIWYIINPTPGTYTLEQTAGSNFGNLRAAIWENVDQTTPLVNAAQGDAVGAIPTLNVTVPTNGLAIDCLGWQFGDLVPSAQGAGQTLLGIDGAGDGSTFNAAAASYEVASGTVAMDWSGSTEGPHVGAALQYAAGGGGGGFQAAWARRANTVISSGARAA